jgi:hypothetical protein
MFFCFQLAAVVPKITAIHTDIVDIKFVLYCYGNGIHAIGYENTTNETSGLLSLSNHYYGLLCCQNLNLRIIVVVVNDHEVHLMIDRLSLKKQPKNNHFAPYFKINDNQRLIISESPTSKEAPIQKKIYVTHSSRCCSKDSTNTRAFPKNWRIGMFFMCLIGIMLGLLCHVLKYA